MKGKLIKQEEHYILLIVEQEEFERIFATTNPFLLENKNKLSLKNCEAIEFGYDLDELAEKHSETLWGGDKDNIGRASFYIGAKTILELLGDKNFTAEDMRTAFSYGMDVYAEPNDWDKINPYQKLNNHIQSLQKTEWDVDICCYVGNGDKESDSFNDSLATNTGVPKLDENNCLILKRIK